MNRQKILVKKILKQVEEIKKKDSNNLIVITLEKFLDSLNPKKELRIIKNLRNEKIKVVL